MKVDSLHSCFRRNEMQKLVRVRRNENHKKPYNSMVKRMDEHYRKVINYFSMSVWHHNTILSWLAYLVNPGIERKVLWLSYNFRNFCPFSKFACHFWSFEQTLKKLTNFHKNENKNILQKTLTIEGSYQEKLDNSFLWPLSSAKCFNTRVVFNCEMNSEGLKSRYPDMMG